MVHLWSLLSVMTVLAPVRIVVPLADGVKVTPLDDDDDDDDEVEDPLELLEVDEDVEEDVLPPVTPELELVLAPELLELLLLETFPLLELDEELAELALLPEEPLDDVEAPEEPKVTILVVSFPPPPPPHATRRRTLSDTRTDWMVARMGFPCYQ
jgi:hypothetical protein